MLLGTLALGSSLLGNILAAKGVIATSHGRIVRAVMEMKKQE